MGGSKRPYILYYYTNINRAHSRPSRPYTSWKAFIRSYPEELFTRSHLFSSCIILLTPVVFDFFLECLVGTVELKNQIMRNLETGAFLVVGFSL
jgi:hypothetical protein